MTKEQKEKALAFLKDMQECTYDGVEEIRTAIECLEQSTSNDCVSRQAVIDYLYTNMAWYDENGSIADDSQKLRDITNLVNGIPPVTPTRKVGKWIEERDDYGNITAWHCSNCYEKTGFFTTCAWDYCPNCGSKMSDIPTGSD